MGLVMDSVRASDQVKAANDLADSQVAYAREFQLAKVRNPGITDGHAHQIATEVTNADVTRRQAVYDAIRSVEGGNQ